MFTRRHMLLGTGLAGVALAVDACSTPGRHGEDLHGATDLLALPLDDTPHVADAATASARIAWELMVSDDRVRTENTVMSPSSLAVTLAMLAEGATGESLQGLDDAFGLSGDDRSAAVGALRQALADYEDLPKSIDANDPPESPVVHQANRVVILDDFEVKQPFLDRLASYYDTGATRVPRTGAEDDLSAWANEHTAGLIKKTAIKIRPSTRLITQDAVLFAARWRQGFTRDDVPVPFTTSDGTTADITALGDSLTVPYATGTGWEAIRLPYDDVLAMDVVLPERGVHPSELGFDAVHASIDALSSSQAQAVDVTMPPSDIKFRWDLLDPLDAMGINLEHLDGIFADAFAEQFAQQVVLTVTAKGTVGAALTEVAVGESAMPETLPFVADRPFLMRVLDTRTGWPLFVAIVNDPAAAPD